MYHLVWIAKGDEEQTTFHTHYSSFEWLVILEGLTNASTSFQRFINNVFSDMIDVSVVIYLDDILIYSDNPTVMMLTVHCVRNNTHTMTEVRSQRV